MKTLLIAFAALTLTAAGCKSVYSTTTIEAKKSFVLGDNEHEAFEVTLKNISKEDLAISKMPNGGSKQLIQVLNANQSATLKVERNTALYIENASNNKAAVELNLNTTSHLSMGYKN